MNSPPRYKQLPTISEDEQTATFQGCNARKRKKNIFYILALVATIYVAFSGLRHIFWSNFGFPEEPWACLGAQNNLSGLPSHYTLPSGDKIPSVALGTGKQRY
jgi:hypothetical protein